MRKFLFTVLASGLLCVAAPSAALARHHHHRSHHHRSHARIRHASFGSDNNQVPVTSPAPGASGAPSAGTVMSFTGGVLTIKLGDGSTVSGAVTNATGLECEAAMPAVVQTDAQFSGGGDNGGSGGGDNGGPGGGDNGGASGGENSGDQGGDHGDDQGGNPQMCAATALTPGTAVQEAELSITSAGSIWDKVELTLP